mmetsp:Transcript_28507/g.43565  ORF Transcript_28507/g.43565 Transcript_28507/m.43565 type:complete len:489 (+) Transcript_28507:134-1600(+)
MTSIPYDPTLVLGNIVDKHRIEALLRQAEIQKPLDLAADKMRNLKRQVYKLKMVYQSMLSLVGPDITKLKSLQQQIQTSKRAFATAAVQYATVSLKVQDELYKYATSQDQNKIGSQVESPLDYTQCFPEAHPISFDTIKFDVQYFQNESNKESTLSIATSVSGFVSQSVQTESAGTSREMAASTHASMSTATSQHDLDGTIVIVAHCTHKNALLIDPFVIDPLKAVSAWNMTFSEDMLRTDPSSMLTAALTPILPNQKKLTLLSGCSLSSSFVGFVHILKEESSDSSQKAATVAKSVKDSLSAEFEEATLEGAFGVSSSVTTTAKALLSKSHLNNHASLICRGIIPSMTSKTMTTSVMTMQPGPKEITENLEQMNGKSDPSNDTMDGQIGAAKKGQQFLSLTTSHIEGAVTSLGKVQDAKNQVFDTESMFIAFDDYVKKASVGDAGVPTNFYIKAVSKADVAKCYIRKYYSDGLRYGESSKMAQYGSD